MNFLGSVGIHHVIGSTGDIEQFSYLENLFGEFAAATAANVSRGCCTRKKIEETKISFWEFGKNCICRQENKFSVYIVTK